MAFRFVNDGQFTPVYVSRGALGLTGHSARDFIEGVIKLEDVIHPEDRERARSAIANAVKKRRSFEVDYRLIDRSGHTKWVLERGQGVYDEEGRLLSIEGLAIDITQRKDAEAEKLLVERRLLEGQKLESIGVLAGGIAHDFNNLLTGIIGNANLASLEIPETSRVQQNLKQIEFASQRAAELCQQMLAYAGKGRFVVQRVEFGSLVENTVPLLRASISKRAQLLFELTSDLPPVIADPTQMRQIVMNLVLNASEALGEHDGQIIISTDLRRPTSEYFAGAVLTPPDLNHDFVVLQVRDTGSGMGQETLAKIFDPFFTTKFAGRGLGLAAVLGIIRSHRGGLKVVSTPGAGSTFTLLFPVTPGPAEPGAPRRNTAVPWRQEGLALIIDDEDHVRHVTAGMLQTCGMKTELARDGYEGLDLFRAKPNDFDLVVLDMTMPRLSGEETLQLLREVNPDVRVLFISGYNRREVVDTLGGNGALSFIQKPFTLEILRDQLRNMLA
jgi:PAS domain S-box-containing protein